MGYRLGGTNIKRRTNIDLSRLHLLVRGITAAAMRLGAGLMTARGSQTGTINGAAKQFIEGDEPMAVTEVKAVEQIVALVAQPADQELVRGGGVHCRLHGAISEDA